MARRVLFEVADERPGAGLAGHRHPRELRRHWHQHGGVPADLYRRLLAYLIQVGLDPMSYDAFKNRPDDLARNADHVLDLVRVGHAV